MKIVLSVTNILGLINCNVEFWKDLLWPSGYNAWLQSMSLQVPVSAGSP